MRCPYCSARATGQLFSNQDLELEEIKHCIEILARIATKLSLLGGEPTCLQKFPEVIKYIKAKGLGVEIVTNGLKIDPLIQVLNFVDRVVISIDGPDARTYGVFRNERLFEKVLNNARFLASRVPVDINCVVHKYNFSVLDRMVDLARDIKAEGVNFLQFINPGIPKAKELVLTHYEVIETLILLGEKIKCEGKANLPSINPRFTYPLVVDYVNKVYNYSIPLPTHMCGAGITFFYVNQRGELFPCDRIATNWVQYKNKSNLLKNDLEEILTNDLFQKAFSFQAALDTYSKWVPCNRCPYLREICFPCPVAPNELVEQKIVLPCYTIETMLEIEVLPNVLCYIETDKSRGLVYNPLYGEPLELNKTAVEILEAIRSYNNLKAVLEAIAKKYQKEVKEVYKDVIQTIDILCKQGIVRYRGFALDQGSSSQ